MKTKIVWKFKIGNFYIFFSFGNLYIEYLLSIKRIYDNKSRYYTKSCESRNLGRSIIPYKDRYCTCGLWIIIFINIAINLCSVLPPMYSIFSYLIPCKGNIKLVKLLHVCLKIYYFYGTYCHASVFNQSQWTDTDMTDAKSRHTPRLLVTNKLTLDTAMHWSDNWLRLQIIQCKQLIFLPNILTTV